jgi:hypothetical protein
MRLSTFCGLRRDQEQFSSLLVDTFPEVARIFPRYHIPWYMMKDFEIYREDYLLTEFCPSCYDETDVFVVQEEDLLVPMMIFLSAQ